jgi:hypothetical protein
MANENNLTIASDPDPTDSKLFAARQWLKGNKIVVELGQKTASKKGYYQSRLCVIRDNIIQIPSILEDWEYR